MLRSPFSGSIKSKILVRVGLFLAGIFRLRLAVVVYILYTFGWKKFSFFSRRVKGQETCKVSASGSVFYGERKRECFAKKVQL